MTIGWIPLGLGVALVIAGLVFGWREKESLNRVVFEIWQFKVSAFGSMAVLLAFGVLGVYWGIELLTKKPSLVSPDSISANATRVHPEDRGLTYDAINTLDGNLNTAWNGVGPCIGCKLHYEFGRPRDLETVSLVNGYAKSKFAFQGNARLKDVRFVMSGDRQFKATLTDSPEAQDVHGDFGTTEDLTIEILSVYPGDNKDLNDAALTEVEFFDE